MGRCILGDAVHGHHVLLGWKLVNFLHRQLEKANLLKLRAQF